MSDLVEYLESLRGDFSEREKSFINRLYAAADRIEELEARNAEFVDLLNKTRGEARRHKNLLMDLNRYLKEKRTTAVEAVLTEIGLLFPEPPEAE